MDEGGSLRLDGKGERSMRALLIGVGLLLVADTAFAACIGNWNLGTVLPALLGLPLLLIGAFYEPARALFATPVGRWIKGLLFFGYGAFLTALVVVTACILHYSAQPPQPGADAVIVLGAGLRGEAPSPALAARLDAAQDYLAENPEAVVVVTGGQGPDEQIPEAHAMARYLTNHGVAAERILLEDRSASTQENLVNAREILDERFPGGARVVLVTSDYHLLRASLVARQVGLNVEPLGSATSPWLLPNCYLRETVAVTGYFVLGRLG